MRAALPIVALLLVLTEWRLATGSKRIAIEAPRLGTPAVAAPGDAIRARLSSSDPTWRPEYRARLVRHPDWVGRSEPIALEVRVLDRGARAELELVLPEDCPEGPWSLVVSADEARAVRPRAVFVDRRGTRSPGDGRPITIAQLADLPTFGGDGSGDRAFARLLDEIALVDPDFVLFTGDIAYGGTHAQFRAFHDALLALEVPSIVAAGNHEYDGWGSYLELFGRPWHTVDLFGVRVVSLDSAHGRDRITASQMAYLRTALAERDGRTALVQLHHPVFGDRSLGKRRQAFVDLLFEHDVPIVVSGHLHGDRLFDASGTQREDTWSFDGTKFVVTTAAGADLRGVGSSPDHHGRRLIRLSEGEVVDYTYDFDGDGERDAVASIPVGGLEIVREDGRTRVESRLNESFTGARVVLEQWQPEPTGFAPVMVTSAEPASIVQVERYETRAEPAVDGWRVIYELEVDLPAKSKHTFWLRSEDD